jgi:prepilin-type processing-associated H-X9-DG protein
LLPAIQAAREAARRAQCESNIHNAALAVLNYESAKKVLPNGMTINPSDVGTMNKLASYGPNWIIDILPYMEEQALRDSFDPSLFIKPGTTGFAPVNDNPANVKNQAARGAMIPALLCPSDPFNRTLYQGGTATAKIAKHGGNYARTNYAASAGLMSIYPGNFGSYYTGGWKDACQRGVMGVNDAVTLKRITDGTSKTIMLGEIRAGITENDARGAWALGHGGITLLAAYGSNSDDPGPNYCNIHGDDTIADVCNNLSGWCTVAPPTPTDSLGRSECMTCDSGGGTPDGMTVRSKHPGGAHIAMADGSVQWISDDVDTGSGCHSPPMTTWDRMIARADEDRGGQLQASGLGSMPCKTY